MKKEVNFKIAKLLKEKGYFYKTPKYYTTENPHSYHKGLDGVCILGLLHSNTLYEEYTKRDEESGLLIYQITPSIVHAPTIAEVVMWLYEQHKIWVFVSKIKKQKWYYTYQTGIESEGSECDFNTPTEAYEAAIGYTLNNLI